METQKMENKKSLPEYADMYEISGQDPITEHSFERYQKDKEKAEAGIKYLRENSVSSYQKKIENAIPEESALLTEQGLKSDNEEMRKMCAFHIQFTRKKYQAELIEKGLGSKYPDTRKDCAMMIKSAPQENQTGLQEKIDLLLHSDFENNLRLIQYATEKKRAEFIKLGLKNKSEKIQKESVEMIRFAAPEHERSSLIEIGLTSQNQEIQEESANAIEYVPNYEMATLIRRCLSIGGKTGMIGAGKIYLVPRKEIYGLIDLGLSKSDARIQNQSAQYVSYVPEEERDPLLKKITKLTEAGLENGTAENYEQYALMILQASSDKREILREKVSSFIAKGFESEKEDRKKYAEMIWYASNDKKASLIEAGLKNNDKEVQEKCASIIGEAPKGKRVPLIVLGLQSKNPKVQKESAQAIEYADATEKAALIKLALSVGTPEVQKICAPKIAYVPMESRNAIKEHMASLLERSFADGNEKNQKEYVWMIKYLPKEKKSALIERGLISHNPEIQKAYALMIEHIPEQDKEPLFEIAKEKMGNLFIEPPLYKTGETSKEAFSRNNFEKTGSKLTLVGGELKDKTVLRQIDIDPFLAWQRLYEDYALWKNAGFEYVPIEPIQSFKVDKDETVDVYSGVLDLSLAQWEEMGGNFSQELESDRKRILRVLRENRIIHGHTHDNNFCLRFFRDESGKADFTRKPRIYLIDFDQAFIGKI
ncbi:MAG: hypothetical protein NTZ13_04440 [Candidatus Parcubacteria bacterium]|nr:hypothetical protein [Candidatus Parcubacteria bacterium]